KPETLTQIACRLMRDERMQAAVAEESRKLLRGSAPDAVKALLAMIHDPNHRGHARAVSDVLARTDPVMGMQHVTATRTADPVLTKAALARIEELTKKWLTPPPKQIEQTIELEAVPVPPPTEASQ